MCSALFGGKQSVSVPLFGDSFFIRMYSEEAQVGEVRFRPLIRGFFFYST